MKRSLVTLEMVQYNREWIVWTVILTGLIVMGLAFYPAISGSMNEISALFENPLMGTMLSAFGTDAFALSSLSGFYRTYASIYVTLLGCIYAAMGGAKRLSREEQHGTAEYLLTRPVRRGSVYWTKAAVLIVHLALLNLVVLGGSVASLEFFGRAAPHSVWLTPRTTKRIADALEQRPDTIDRYFNRNRELYEKVLTEAAGTQFSALSLEDAAAGGIDRDSLGAMLGQMRAVGPSELLADAARNPAKYRVLLGVEGVSDDELLGAIRERQAELDSMWSVFHSDAARFHEFFRMAPLALLTPLAESDRLGTFLVELDLPSSLAGRVYAAYPLRGITQLVFYGFLAMVVFGMAGLLMSTVVRSSDTAVAVALGIVLVAYFIDVITSAAGAGEALRWISPIAMIDIETNALAYFLGTGAAAAAGGAFAFSRRDLFVP